VYVPVAEVNAWFVVPLRNAWLWNWTIWSVREVPWIFPEIVAWVPQEELPEFKVTGPLI